jgi:hypothetical protein
MCSRGHLQTQQQSTHITIIKASTVEKYTYPYSVDIVKIHIVKKIKESTFYPILDHLCN